MKFALYFASGVTNRIISLFSLILLTYFLSGFEFGTISMIVSNALLLQICLGSWLSSGIGREFSISDREIWPTLIATAIVAVIAIAGIASAVAALAVIAGVTPISPAAIGATVTLAVVLVCYESVQAAQNARGHASAHAAFATVRNLLVLSFAVVTALVAKSALNVAVAYIAANCISIILIVIRYRKQLRIADLRLARIEFRRLHNFGLEGSLLYGYYIILMAIFRNIVAAFFGVEEAGIWGLVIDLVIAPVTLFSSAMSLTFMPKLYSSSAKNSDVEKLHLSKTYLFIHSCVLLIYGFCAILVLPYLFPLFLKGEGAAFSQEYIVQIVMFAIAVILQQALATIFLTQGRKAALRACIVLGLLLHSLALMIAIWLALPVQHLITLTGSVQWLGVAISGALYLRWLKQERALAS